VENDLKYEGYIKRMLSDVEKYKKAEQRRIPEDFDYGVLNSISTEARQKLQRIRPETIGQAGRISGISATDLSILTLYLTK
jgi:tRNA uridine 5-carboxymethylaminomethyl modification enzyme